MNRRSFTAAVAAVPLLVAASRLPAATRPVVEVWKSPTCGCCNEWIRHMQANGFSVKTFDTGNAMMRRALGIPTDLGGCHTARVEGYAIEGHVPAREVRRLLDERPDAIGLAVPGMPIGAPGMEQGSRIDPYTVLLIRRDATTKPYASYGA